MITIKGVAGECTKIEKIPCEKDYCVVTFKVDIFAGPVKDCHMVVPTDEANNLVIGKVYNLNAVPKL